VEVTRLGGRVGAKDNHEIVEVDVSRILEYVSAAELERHENEQFRIEAEAEAVARRAEAEEVTRRNVEKNARTSRAGRGSRMLSGMTSDMNIDTPTRGRGGRPRGRQVRGRGRDREGLVLVSRPHDDTREELVDVELEVLVGEDEGMERVIAETESEDDEEEDAQAQLSPDLMRSAFVANSALPISPVAINKRLSTSRIQRGHPQISDIEDSDIEMGDYDARSMSSAALRLSYEDTFGERAVGETQDEGHISIAEHQHLNKRRRLDSSTSPERIPEDAFRQTPLFQDHSSEQDPEINSSNDIIPEQAFRQTLLFQNRSSLPSSDADDSVPAQPSDSDAIHVVTPRNGTTPHPPDMHSDDEDAEEYVVESIIEHFHEGEKKYYLVKWEGYEDSHDWLPEEDLEGARDLVDEYNERVRRRKKKGKERAR
jgi:hypothetical protein